MLSDCKYKKTFVKSKNSIYKNQILRLCVNLTKYLKSAMGHHHIYTGNPSELKSIRRITWIGFWVNLVLLLLKLSVGYFGHSDALMADGVHSLNDFAADFIVLIFVGVAYRAADDSHPYGHGKFETLASLLISTVLFVVAAGILFEGVKSMVDAFRGILPERPDFWTIVVAFFAIMAKEILFRYTRRTGRRTGSSALIANAWHERTDAITSLATLLGVTGAYFLGENWRILDPIASVIIGVIIAVSAARIGLPALDELLEKSIPAEEREILESIVKGVEGVKGVGKILTRRNGKLRVADVSIYVDGNLSVAEGCKVAENVERTLKSETPWPILASIHLGEAL